MARESEVETEKLMQIGFRGTEEYRARLKMLAASRRMSVQDLVKEAVDTYLGEGTRSLTDADGAGKPVTQVPVPERAPLTGGTSTGNRIQITKEHSLAVSLHELLSDILNSGNELFINGLRANLEAWGFVVRSLSERAPSEQRSEDAETRSAADLAAAVAELKRMRAGEEEVRSNAERGDEPDSARLTRRQVG